jgi:6-phosphofructokinase 2
MQTILTFTINPAIDASTTVDHVVPERKLRCGPPRFDPGGGGINVSRAIKRLGGESTALYTSGGFPGKMLQELLDAEGLCHLPIPIEGLTRENLHIYEESTGQQFRFNMPGATLTEAEWRQCLETLAAFRPKPGYVVFSGSLAPGVPVDFYAAAVRIAKRLGARVILDTNGESLRLAVQEGVFLLKPNFRELGQLAGTKAEDESRLEASAERLIADGRCEAVVVSLAAAGAILVTREGSERLIAPPVRAVSKVGAGDSMVAGIVLSLARGGSLREAARFGVAAGTAAVMREGTQLCRREDAERLYAQMGP